ncbi:hypothetical protein NX794_25400 [Streptomyces sp. LP11]|uniref:Uncharacterized protein n=1 Tax=Streptomyces pyxinicus TaxID=2970331 RepID=A0ABT2B7N1_9ACTN|nr:hypothetical protein [Streptomyces sp. LP11]MCS0604525.1 hypothetical protein [Streptomyces sp. LP11]
MTFFVALILGLLLVILGLTTSWPWWAWPAAGALLLLTAILTQRQLAPRPVPVPGEFLAHPDLPLPETQRQEYRISHVALPSCVRDYDFSFSATVQWRVLDVSSDAPVINPAGLAVDAVLERARAVTVHQPPHRSSLAQHQLDGALGTMCTDATGRVTVMAYSVELSLPEHDRERLSRLSDVRKDEDVWEHERNYERNKRTYLGDDVLKDTGSAVVWWLSRNDEEIEGAVERIGMLAQLSAAARNEPVAPLFEHLAYPRETPAPDNGGRESATGPEASGAGPAEPAPESPFSTDTLLSWFGVAPDDPDRDLFATRLADVARAHGKKHAEETLLKSSTVTEPLVDDGEYQ